VELTGEHMTEEEKAMYIGEKLWGGAKIYKLSYKIFSMFDKYDISDCVEYFSNEEDGRQRIKKLEADINSICRFGWFDLKKHVEGYVKWLSSPEGLDSIGRAMIDMGYEYEFSYQKEFLGMENQYYICFKLNTRAWSAWGDCKPQAIIEAAYMALKEESDRK
jgi:hypothetical protein